MELVHPAIQSCENGIELDDGENRVCNMCKSTRRVCSIELQSHFRHLYVCDVYVLCLGA